MVLSGNRLGAAPGDGSRKDREGPTFTVAGTLLRRTRFSTWGAPCGSARGVWPGGMEPVEEHPDDEHPLDNNWFMVHGVRCKAEAGDRIRYGWQLPSRQRPVVKRTLTKDRAQAVFYHKDFASVRQLIRASDSRAGAMSSAHHQHCSSSQNNGFVVVGAQKARVRQQIPILHHHQLQPTSDRKVRCACDCNVSSVAIAARLRVSHFDGATSAPMLAQESTRVRQWTLLHLHRQWTPVAREVRFCPPP